MARTSSASPSQSRLSETKSRTLPDVSPLRHKRPREREKKWTSRVSTVSRSASSSMYASMRTRPERASCTIAGVSLRWRASRSPASATFASAHRDAGLGERAPGVGDGELAEVEDGGGEHRVGAPVDETGDQVGER